MVGPLNPSRMVVCLVVLLVMPVHDLMAAPAAPYAPDAANSGLLLKWNTFFRDSQIDGPGRTAIDESGNIYAVGYSFSSWSEPLRPFAGTSDIILAKLDTDGSLLWMTFLGGEDGDAEADVALDENGYVYVAGISRAAWSCLDAPCTILPYDKASPTFVAKFTPDGTLLWNTFLGGGTSGASDLFVALAVDGDDAVFVTGRSDHAWGSPIRPYAEEDDAFVARLDSAGNLIWNTFLGSSDNDHGNDIAIDRLGNVYVAGTSYLGWSCDPEPPSCLVRPFSAYDAFVAKLGSNGSLLWNTFLGGAELDRGYGIDVDSSDRILVTGYSESSWGAPIRAYTEGVDQWTQDDVFVALLDSSGSLVWNTFLGGYRRDRGHAAHVSQEGDLYVAGSSDVSWDVSTRETYESALVARLDPDGHLIWHHFFGGPYDDFAYGLASDKAGNVVVSGYSDNEWGSPLLPFAGDTSVFIAKFAPIASSTWLPWSAIRK